jgi:hypothetical protein
MFCVCSAVPLFMVGPPKTLQDLRKVEGAVRVTCRACRKVNILDREHLILMRNLGRQSCDWSIVVRDMSCPNCSDHDEKVDIEAFADGLPKLRRRRAAMITIELALKILLLASYSGTSKSVPVEAVRLALRAVHPVLQDGAMLEGFWARYSDPDPRLGETPGGCYADIVKRLLKCGYAVPAELRMGV